MPEDRLPGWDEPNQYRDDLLRPITEEEFSFLASQTAEPIEPPAPEERWA